MKVHGLIEAIEENKETQKLILPIMYSYKDKRDKILNEEEKEKFREGLRKIKEETIENIIELKKQAIENLIKNGIKVIEAKDSEDANKKIRNILEKEKLIIKSKSNTTNEINLNEWRENIGYVSQDIFLKNDTIANNIKFYSE